MSGLLYRLRALFRRRQFDADLDDELRLHVDLQADRHVRAGMSREAALRRARLELGGVAQVTEATREAWGVQFFEATVQDVHHAARMLAKAPAFTLAVVTSLALGIGANTAIFTLMDAVMWRTLPVKDPGGLLAVGQRDADDVETGFNYREFAALREHATQARLAGYATATVNVSVAGPPEASIEAVLVSGDYFSLVGVSASAGRTIEPADDSTANGQPVVMLSDGYWQRRFARDPLVIGRTIRLSDTPFTVIGVTPPAFFGVDIGTSPDVYVPLTMQPTVMPAYENLLDNPGVNRRWVEAIARLSDGATLDSASTELGTILRAEAARLNPGSGGAAPPPPAALVPVTSTSPLRRQFSRPLVVLLAMVGVVLLIACANAANLLLSRAAARQAEFAMRAALGASRGRLLRQMLTESALLALVAGAGGVLLAYWTARLLVGAMSVGRVPIVLDMAPNMRVLAFTATVSLLTGLVFGLAPGLRATRRELVHALTSVRSSLTRSLRVDRVLSVAQLALSLLLLVAAGLFVRSLRSLNGDDEAGLRERVVMVRVEPRGADQRNVPGASERLDRTYRALMERVGEMPGVLAVSMANTIPTSPASSSSVRLPTPGGDGMRVPSLMVYPGYFSTIGIPVLAGREFAEGDLGEHSAPVCIVNQSFVRQFVTAPDPLGQPCHVGRRSRLMSLPKPPDAERFTIVGVVQDSRFSNPRGETRPMIYQTFLQANTGRGQMVLHLRLAGSLADVVQRVRQEVARIDPAVPVFNVHTLEEEMQAALVQQRLIAMLAAAFGAVALLLASIGLYGLFAFSVVQRRAEIGVRMAIGARRTQVTWLVLGDAMRLIAVGIAIGAPAAYAAGKLAANRLSGLLYGLDATDPVTIAGASAMLAIVAAAAVVLPARYATRVDPLSVLRSV